MQCLYSRSNICNVCTVSVLEVRIVQFLYATVSQICFVCSMSVLEVRIVQCLYYKSGLCNVYTMSQISAMSVQWAKSCNVCIASQDKLKLYSLQPHQKDSHSSFHGSKPFLFHHSDILVEKCSLQIKQYISLSSWYSVPN